MRPWMRVLTLGAVLGAAVGLAGCESEDDDDGAAAAGADPVADGAEAGGEASSGEADGPADGDAAGEASTDAMPELVPVVPALDPAMVLKPDLTITDLAPAPAPLFGWVVKATVKNAGKVNSGGFAIRLYRDGAQRDTLNVPGLVAGAQATLTFPAYSFGCPENAPDLTMRAVADPGNQIAEADETNNAHQETWGCPPP